MQALETGTAGGKASSRLSFLSTTLTQLVTDYVSQALFNADRLAFGVHLAHGLLPHLFQATEWDLFLGNALGEWFRVPLSNKKGRLCLKCKDQNVCMVSCKCRQLPQVLSGEHSKQLSLPWICNHGWQHCCCDHYVMCSACFGWLIWQSACHMYGKACCSVSVTFTTLTARQTARQCHSVVDAFS